MNGYDVPFTVLTLDFDGKSKGPSHRPIPATLSSYRHCSPVACTAKEGRGTVVFVGDVLTLSDGNKVVQFVDFRLF